MKKLAIITTHPIQYNAPLFRLLHERGHIEIKVFYTWGQSSGAVFDKKFGMQRSWDIPLLEGYSYEFVRNISPKPDSNRFWGVINPGLYRKIKLEKFDAVLLYRWSVFSHFYLMQKLGKRPALFFRGDSHLLQSSGGMKQIVKQFFLRFVYRKLDAAFVVGSANKAYMQQNGLAEHQLINAMHAVDNERFFERASFMEERALNERFALGIPAGAIVFLYAGKFYALKQLDFLIQAFRQFEGDQYRLLLVGNGEEEERLKLMARSDKRILFLPFHNQSEMPWVYRMGNVFILPSKSETWGLGVNEAMACRRAAIVSDMCGCAPDIIQNGINGFVFRSGDREDLLRCLKAFTDKGIVEKMGTNAFQIIQQFSFEKIALSIEEAVVKTNPEQNWENSEQ